MNMIHKIEDRLSIVISGSFRKHYKDICVMIRNFENQGIEVLSPRHSTVINPGEDFVLLETDETTCPEKLEREHLNAICQASALYLYNPDGYVGLSSAMEVGWALALGKPIYVNEVCEDATLRYFASKTAKPEEIRVQLIDKQDNLADILSPQLSLVALQSYVQKIIDKRGFGEETPRDKVLLMLEEFGELAKALRKYVGLKIDKEREQQYADLKFELADILFYLLDLANTCGIDLFEAFREKETENAKRRWGNV